MLGRQGHGQGDSRVVFLRAGIYRSGGQDNDSSPRHDACRCLRARGNWHLTMLAANRARALRFPMSKVGSVSPAATALLSTAQHRCCCKVSDPNKDPGKDGIVRMRSWITVLRNSRSRSVESTHRCASHPSNAQFPVHAITVTPIQPS
ncbi:hypothetical protein V8C43DRAFT_306135 [Trichoderma afarasin]